MKETNESILTHCNPILAKIYLDFQYVLNSEVVFKPSFQKRPRFLVSSALLSSLQYPIELLPPSQDSFRGEKARKTIPIPQTLHRIDR